MRALLRPLTLSLALVVAAAPGCRRTRSHAAPPDEARQLLLDRNWIDRLPQNVGDKLHVYRFVPAMGGGVFQDRTLFAGTFELFQFRQDGRTIAFDLLHTGERRSSAFTIEPIAPQRPGDVDLKLTLADSPRGPAVYYGWRKEGAAGVDLDATLADVAMRARRPHLPR